MTYMEELRLTKEEERVVRKHKMKADSGIATKIDEEEAVYAVMEAMIRDALDPYTDKEMEEYFRDLRVKVEKLFPETAPLSDVPYFIIGQLGQYCIDCLEKMKNGIIPSVLENFEDAESYLQFSITNYLNGYNATRNIITEISMSDAANDKTIEDRLRVKKIALSYLPEAYRQKDKDTLFVIFALLNLSDN